MSFLSVAAPHTAEKVIEKSRFLTYAAHTAGEEEARAFLERVRAEHPLATHVCHAYVADRLGNLMRFSDDGEPQGTAGMPILGVLRARKLFECAVAVVRIVSSSVSVTSTSNTSSTPNLAITAR